MTATNQDSPIAVRGMESRLDDLYSALDQIDLSRVEEATELYREIAEIETHLLGFPVTDIADAQDVSRDLEYAHV